MKIISVLSDYEPQDIRLAFCASCSGNNDYIEQIKDIFKEVKRGVSGPVAIFGNFKGISIAVNNVNYPKIAGIVFEAFQAGGIPIYYSPDPNVNGEDVVIVVGSIK